MERLISISGDSRDSDSLVKDLGEGRGFDTFCILFLDCLLLRAEQALESCCICPTHNARTQCMGMECPTIPRWNCEARLVSSLRVTGIHASVPSEELTVAQ